MKDQRYDVVFVGSGFASSFFLYELLKYLPQNAHLLVLERGKKGSHRWRVDNREKMQKHGVISSIDYRKTFVNKNPTKDWVYTPAFGGGSNCWWGCTPRFHPNDFSLYSEYGVGKDWPLSYNELEHYYTEAEHIMHISGDSTAFFNRSKPYPLDPHNLSKVDEVLKRQYGKLYFAQPCARPSESVGNRPACCASSVCNLCPIDAKFTIQNGLQELYSDSRVEVVTGAKVDSLDTEGGNVTEVIYTKKGMERRAVADTVVLGANALFNPYILQQSGFLHEQLGRNLTEQLSVTAKVLLNGLDNFQGSTSYTAHGYMLYDGSHRRDAGACLIESSNIPKLRLKKGKHRQVAYFRLIVENLPEEQNRILKGRTKPIVHFKNHSDYGLRGIERAKAEFKNIVKPLPVEQISFSSRVAPTESHILGTTVMGDDPNSSIVDRDLIHHEKRNLFVLGGGVFPTISPANPTLTICALSLRAARKFGRML